MNREELEAKIRQAAPQGKIPCATAFQVAKESGISRKEMGNLLNELRIKIVECQLGCF